jgi:hypothetical protein
MKTPRPAPLFRVVLGLTVCAFCFQAGRWTGRLQTLSETTGGSMVRDSGNEMVVAINRTEPKPKPVEPAPLVKAGDPVGEQADLITPLNVRDPSALVMAPSVGGAPFAGEIPPPPPPASSYKRARPKNPTAAELAESDRILKDLGRKPTPKDERYPKKF